MAKLPDVKLTTPAAVITRARVLAMVEFHREMRRHYIALAKAHELEGAAWAQMVDEPNVITVTVEGAKK